MVKPTNLSALLSLFASLTSIKSHRSLTSLRKQDACFSNPFIPFASIQWTNPMDSLQLVFGFGKFLRNDFQVKRKSLSSMVSESIRSCLRREVASYRAFLFLRKNVELHQGLNTYVKGFGRLKRTAAEKQMLNTKA